MVSADNVSWICFGVSLVLNVVLVLLYIRLSKQTKDIRSFKVDTLNTIFYRDTAKQNKKG